MNTNLTPNPAPATPSPSKAKPKFHNYPWWSPRFWHGMRFGDWIKLAASHQFRIHPLRWPMAIAIGMVTPFNTVMGTMQSLLYGKKIAAAQITQPPVFIVGHWRSGTTYLHELLAQDERFVTPTTYQCFAPHHFLLTEWFIAGYCGFLMPKQRPMDDMVMGWDRPQEDEFALLTLGAPTPYLRMAFCNDPPPYEQFFNMQAASAEERAAFEKALMHFVKMITFDSSKQLLMKSPPHTGRIELLSKMFPGAKFIHISRNPYQLYSSTVRLWKSLDEVQSLQWPKGKGLEEYVLRCLPNMYEGYASQKELIPSDCLCEMRYEDLVKDPLGEVKRAYNHLGLDSFAALEPRLQEFTSKQKDYKVNKHEMDEETKSIIRSRWADYFTRFGYAA